MHLSPRTGIIGGVVVLAAAMSAVSFAASNPHITTITAIPGTNPFATIAPAVNSSSVSYPTGYAGLPTIRAVSGYVGTIGAGRLYTITPTVSGNATVTLYLSNAGNLANDYAYFTAQVTLYQRAIGSTTWTKIPGISQVLSLNNGSVTFSHLLLNPADTYDLVVETGSFDAASTTAAHGSLNPQFYLTVTPTNG